MTLDRQEPKVKSQCFHEHQMAKQTPERRAVPMNRFVLTVLLVTFFFFWYHKLEQLLSNGNRSSSKVSLLILCPLTCEPSFQNSIWKHYSLVTVKIFLKWIIYHFTAIKWVDVSWPFYLLMESFVVGEKKMNGRKITLLLFEYWILTTYNKTALQEVKKYFKI